MKKIVLSTAAVLAASGALIAGPAVAADFGGMKGGYAAPAPVYVPPAFRWTGFYVGLQGGYMWGDADHSFNDATLGGTSDQDGWIGGGHLGYNWQTGPWVLGLEADIEGGDVGGSYANLFSAGSYDVNWMGSLRGRVGFAADRTLFYTTAGWAFADVDAAGVTLTHAGAGSDTVNGWTLGAGVEHAFTNNFTMRFEYRYTDFGDTSVRLTDGLGGVVTMPVEVDTHALRVGASWKF
jgi:outer membrane immunogenic protein